MDTDLALGAFRGDVDDGFAIAAILAAPDAELLGITTVFGNTAAAVAADCAARLCAVAGRRVPVIAGAARAGESIAAAVDAIVALPAGTTLLALGPLTNVAAALARDPSLAARIRVSLVGGNLSSRGRWPPWWPFEFNLAKDAAAARAVFASAVPRGIYPLDVASALTVGVAELRAWSRASPLAAYLVRHCWRWLAYAPLRYRRLRFPLWDLVPALDALGVLSGVHVERQLACVGRGLLVDDAAATPAGVLTSFDPRAARAAFRAIIE